MARVSHISGALGHRERECGALYIQRKFPDHGVGASHKQDEFSLLSYFSLEITSKLSKIHTSK